MAAPSSDPRSTGKNKCDDETLCSPGRDRRLFAAKASSKFTVRSCRPWLAQFLLRRLKVFKSSWQLCDWIVQKFSRTGLPRRAARVRVWPDESGKEKSGAEIGTSSQVSTAVGIGSASCGNGAGSRASLTCVLKGSMRSGAEPSPTQILCPGSSSRSSCTRPLGQRIHACTGPLACPSPKNNSLLHCDRKPEPACRVRVCRPVAVSIVTTAPIASRLLLVP